MIGPPPNSPGNTDFWSLNLIFPSLPVDSLIETDRVDVFEDLNELRDLLVPLPKQGTAVIALRASQRVAIFVKLRMLGTEAVAAGIEIEPRIWSSAWRNAAALAGTAITYATDANAAYAYAEANNSGFSGPYSSPYADPYAYAYADSDPESNEDAASTTAYATISAADAAVTAVADPHHSDEVRKKFADEARKKFIRLVSLDIARVEKISTQAKVPALIGWDDPRLGPLWPEGPPAWHREAEQLIVDLQTKLADRRDSGELPVSKEALAQIGNFHKLEAMAACGELKTFKGEYVVVLDGKLVGHATDCETLLKKVNEEFGKLAAQAACRYVY